MRSDTFEQTTPQTITIHDADGITSMLDVIDRKILLLIISIMIMIIIVIIMIIINMIN